MTKHYTVTVVKPLPKSTKTVANLATSSEGTCSDCHPVNPVAGNLSVSKVIGTVNGKPASATTAVTGGDKITYNIVLINTGGSSVTTALSDPVPANSTYTGTGEGWSCAVGAKAGTKCGQEVTVAAGATVTEHYTMTVVDPLPDGSPRWPTTWPVARACAPRVTRKTRWSRSFVFRIQDLRSRRGIVGHHRSEGDLHRDGGEHRHGDRRGDSDRRHVRCRR